MYSCNILEHDPQDSITPEDAFDSEVSVRNIMLGVYDKLQSDSYYGGSFQYLADNYADISTYNGFYTEFDEADSKNLPTTNILVEKVWLGIYSVINVTNELIGNIDNVIDSDFTVSERNELIAEAKTIRALCYLDLLVHFGEHWDLSSSFGIPLFDQSTNSDFANVESIARNTVEETYQFILKDLNDAANVGLSNSNAAYASNGLINALFVRLYLHKKDYSNALNFANVVIQNSIYSLNEVYSDNFHTEFSSESIFELASSSLDPTNLALYTISRNEVLPETDLKNSFDSLDTRRGLISVIDGLDDIERFLKADDFSSHGNPAYIMRLAEVYLYRAEANYHLGNLEEALSDINFLRKRAGIIVHDDIGNLLDKYLDENRWELFAEGKRLSTLTRIGVAQELLVIDDFRRIYPIPAREFTIEGNLIVQNPGYE